MDQAIKNRKCTICQKQLWSSNGIAINYGLKDALDDYIKSR